MQTCEWGGSGVACAGDDPETVTEDCIIPPTDSQYHDDDDDDDHDDDDDDIDDDDDDNYVDDDEYVRSTTNYDKTDIVYQLVTSLMTSLNLT
jgi:hypothetical protein